MNRKNLVLLAAILAVLVVLVIVKHQQETPIPIQDAVKLRALLPEGLSKADIAKLEFCSGALPDEKLILVRDADDPDKWRVETHFNAPVATDKIDGYLDKLVKLKGEFRSGADSDEILGKYELGEDASFQIAGYRKAEDQPAFRLLIGKSPKWKSTFVRTADGDEVYAVDVDLKQEAGVRSTDEPKAPEASAWLDKDVLDLDKEAITKIDWDTPDKTAVFERVAIEKPEEPAEEAKEGEDAATPPEPEVEYEWKAAVGGPGTEKNQRGIDSMLRALDKLTAADIVDPEKVAEWGLDTPAFKCTVSVESQDEDVVIEGGRPDPDGDGYIRLANAEEPVIYKVSKYTFEQLFPKGSQLFELPKLAVKSDDVNRVEIVQPEGNVVLFKEGEDWKVVEPVADLPIQSSKINGMVGGLAAWQAADYADDAAGTGLDAPARRVTFTTTTGESHTIAVGDESKHIAGRYARLDDAANVATMSKIDFEKIFVKPKDLFELTLLDIDGDEIQSIAVERAMDSFSLARQDDGWVLNIGGEAAEVDEESVDDLTFAIEDFQASDIVFGADLMDGEPEATVRCVMQDGTEHVFLFGPDRDGVRQVLLAGKPQLFTVDTADASELLVASESLKALEPVPEAPAEEPAATESGEKSPEGAATPETAATPVTVVPAETEATAQTPAEVETGTTEQPAPKAEAAPEPATETTENPGEEAAEAAAQTGTEVAPAPSETDPGNGA